MNHATISPDGRLLLAVGDRHTAFFCKRVRLPSALSDGRLPYARYEWHEVARLKLSLAESKDACFSTAFSPSGRTYILKTPLKFCTQFRMERVFASQKTLLLLELAINPTCCLGRYTDSETRVDICAVASQNGIITIFDTALIHDDVDADVAVIEVLRSSRPSNFPAHTGAVRSMSFCPGPWDLLAW